MTGNKNITANFAINTYTLNITISGNGTVTKIPDQITYEHGAIIELIATPSDNSWKFSKWEGDASGTLNPLTFTMTANKNITAIFVRDSNYLVLYRSFSPESLAFDKDNKGKINKPVLKKAAFVKFATSFTNELGTIENILHLHFSPNVILDDSTHPFSIKPEPTSIIVKTAGKIIDVFWENGIQPAETVEVNGWGSKGKPMSMIYSWHSYAGGTHNKPSIKNQYYLPMPNRVNALFETFAHGGFRSTNGLVVGISRMDSSRQYGWLRIQKYSNVLKSLIEQKTLQTHTGAARGFDKNSKGKALVKEQKILSPKTHNNVLLAEMIALKFNIAASTLGITPPGFGELIYDDGTSNPLNNMMIKDIAAFGDSLMMGQYDPNLKSKTFAASDVFTNLFETIRRINYAFEGKLDTISFANSLTFTGVKPLVDVPYLKSNPNITPKIIQSTKYEILDAPTTFSLRQNYPNPFNPFTTITFELPIRAIVSLKVYDILGQEVATLIDHEEMEEGEQEIEFDANGLSSGVYFYRLTADGINENETNDIRTTYVNVKKMQLIK